MTDSLVQRLRGEYRMPITDGLGATGGGEEPENPKEFVRRFPASPIMHEAADRIEALEAEVERLRAGGLTQAAADVLAERRRQVEVEGWTAEHDDQHVKGEMAGAAACYALYRSHVDPVELMGEGILEMSWPWDPAWWKPTVPRRDLVKAAALILAEIERLDRAALSPKPEGE